VHDLQIFHFILSELLELRVRVPQKERAYSRSHLSFLDLYPTSHPAGGVPILQEAWNLLSGDVKAISRIAESNLDALSTVDLEPKRPFSVGECAPWVRLAGPQFATQVAAVASLVEAHSNCDKAAAVAKKVMAMKYGNKMGHSIKKLLESPFAGKHPKLIEKGTKAAETGRQ
jgi:hypothetical protein